MDPALVAAARAHVGRADPLLARVADAVGPLPVRQAGRPQDDFAVLCRIIAGQQLSTRAASTIWARLEALATPFTPAAVARLPAESLRACGLSGAKTRFIAEAARRIAAGEIDLAALRALEDAAAGERLRALKGFGPWSVEMYLISALGRSDVFSAGDGGLKRAIALLHGPRAAASPRRVADITGRWSPYRSVACRWLWAWLDAGAPEVAVKRSRRR